MVSDEIILNLIALITVLESGIMDDLIIVIVFWCIDFQL
jgi:hypothetical protein